MAICSARADGRADAPLAVSAGKLGCRAVGVRALGGDSGMMCSPRSDRAGGDDGRLIRWSGGVAGGG